jgi:transposase
MPAGRRAAWPRWPAAAYPARPARLSDDQRAAIVQALRQGARAHGFDTDHWTLARITTVIQRLTGVAYHRGHTWKLLRRMGWRL